MPRVYHGRGKTAWTDYDIEEKLSCPTTKRVPGTTKHFSRQSSGASTAASEGDVGRVQSPHECIRMMSMGKNRMEDEALFELVRKMVFDAAGCQQVLDATDFQGWSLLLVAVQARRGSIVQHLLQLGADPNCSDPESGWTALMYAVALCDVSIAQALVDSGASVDECAAPCGWNPLCVAASTGRWEMAKLLLDAGADLSLANKSQPCIREVFANHLSELSCKKSEQEAPETMEPSPAATWVKDYDQYC
mmetsp:Transcript_54318/g.117548  ORF Transcript_54318/g.117548 Transcript_54318/m.117548 type:complete len:248 (+) Transcript_54318:105-848(+)|eukprot:CAMPEP_0170601778 /NCGR_PEP_ID=MMETSP0224-20130122/18039_1 /TAXON_ID=285029 /ORGANISM="Togula jolla, Strain CCCM 725" /LENGTH=247 /DNA_ID=CAMNT_0010926573 /DNA_START=169 /DNA_END=912 /DNA_ORIENTATION=+